MAAATPQHTLNIATAAQMHAFGAQLGANLQAGDLVLLTGDLGAGKTTLTRGIGAGLHVRGPVTSPTFVLARTHPSQQNGPALIHVDAYRLQDSGELDDLDLDYSNSVVVAEWGAGLVDDNQVSLEIIISRSTGAALPEIDPENWDDSATNEPRTLTLRVPQPRLAQLDFHALLQTATAATTAGETAAATDIAADTDTSVAPTAAATSNPEE